jgi:hypothetical protein
MLIVTGIIFVTLVLRDIGPLVTLWTLLLVPHTWLLLLLDLSSNANSSRVYLDLARNTSLRTIVYLNLSIGGSFGVMLFVGKRSKIISTFI